MFARSMLGIEQSKIAFLLAASSLLLASFSVDAAVGQFKFVTGEVVVIGIDGRSRRVARGSSVDAREVVRTSARSIAQLKMIDNATISLRPNSEIRIDDYRTGEKTDSNRSVLSLFRGAFRAISGLIGQRNRRGYQIKTPTISIGIRGSDALVGHDAMNGLSAVQTIVGSHEVSGISGTERFNVVTTPGDILTVLPDQFPAFVDRFPTVLMDRGSPPAAPTRGRSSGAENQRAPAAGPSGDAEGDPTAVAEARRFERERAETNRRARREQGSNLQNPLVSSARELEGSTQSDAGLRETFDQFAQIEGVLPALIPAKDGFLQKSVFSSGGNFSSSLQNFNAVPQGTSLVGGVLQIESGSQLQGGGGTVLQGVNNGTILLDGANNPVIFSETGLGSGTSFRFAAQNATVSTKDFFGTAHPNTFSGSGVSGRWGVWEGGFAVFEDGDPVGTVGGFPFALSSQTTSLSQLINVRNFQIANSISTLAYNKPIHIHAVNQDGNMLVNQGTLSAVIDFKSGLSPYGEIVNLTISGIGGWGAITNNKSIVQFISDGVSFTGITCPGGCSSASGNVSGQFLGTAANAIMAGFGISDGNRGIVGVGVTGR